MAFKTGEPLWERFAIMRMFPDSPPLAEGLKTGCILPLTSRGRIHGVLLFGRRNENIFSREEVKFLMQVGAK